MLIVSINRNWAWSLGFFNPQWKLNVGAVFPVQVSFDGGTPYSGSANVVQPSLVQLPMADNSALSTAFRASRGMSVSAGGNVYPFALTTTSRALIAVARCVTEELAYENGGAMPDLGLAVASTAPRQSQPLNPSGAEPAPAPATTTVAHEAPLDRTLVATQIATNLLLQAKLPNAHLLNDTDTPDGIRGFGVAWASDVGAGAVKIVDVANGQTGQDVASELIASDAAACKGDFASGRSSELVDNSIVTKAFVACKQSAGMKSARYLIYQGGSAHYVVFDMLPAPGTGSPSEPPPAENTVQSAALRAVSYQTWK